LGSFPNTYTYTKHLAEKNIKNNMGNVKVVIWRPSIIASAQSEPFPGWTDSLSAAGGLTFLGGLGILKIVKGRGVNYFDMIPVDIVCNGLLIVTCNQALSNDQQLRIYNCGTSVQNPITIGQYKEIMVYKYKTLDLNMK
jgi:fatty acyl-CoA reductase